MERTCERAIELGLPAVAFTEHADWSPSPVDASALKSHDHLRRHVGADGLLTPPPLQLEGYLEAVDRCRHRFPALRILTGVELSEPHRHGPAAAALLAAAQFDRVLGSLHSLPVGEGYLEPQWLLVRRPADEVVREYLGEVARLVAQSDAFAVVAHVDYVLRYWPVTAGPLDLRVFRRRALRPPGGRRRGPGATGRDSGPGPR